MIVVQMDFRPLPLMPATGVAKEVQTFLRNRNPFTLKVVADSGLARTKGEMRTMPEKWLGLSAAVRMAMAPPCKAKRAELLCASPTCTRFLRGSMEEAP